MSEEKIKKIINEISSNEERLEALENILERLPEISRSIDILSNMVETGSLETLANILCLLNISKDMVSDEMISGAASLVSSLLDVSAKINAPHIQRLISAVADHPVELESEIKKNRVTGLFSLMRALKDEEVQRGLTLLIAVTKLIGRYGYPSEK